MSDKEMTPVARAALVNLLIELRQCLMHGGNPEENWEDRLLDLLGETTTRLLQLGAVERKHFLVRFPEGDRYAPTWNTDTAGMNTLGIGRVVLDAMAGVVQGHRISGAQLDSVIRKRHDKESAPYDIELLRQLLLHGMHDDTGLCRELGTVLIDRFSLPTKHKVDGLEDEKVLVRITFPPTKNWPSVSVVKNQVGLARVFIAELHELLGECYGKTTQQDATEERTDEQQ